MTPPSSPEHILGPSGYRYALEVYGGHTAKPLDDEERLLIQQRARQVERLALAADLRDDRFGSTGWPSEDWLALFALLEGQPVAYLGGAIGAHLAGQDSNEPINLDLLTASDPAPTADDMTSIALALFDRIDPSLRSRELVLWSKPESPAADALATARNFAPYRSLHQLRCDLPIELAPQPARLPTRPFVVGRDEAAVTLLNNRAFASHPSQGSQPPNWLTDASAEPWFDPEGLRLYENPRNPGEPIGFCWTKIHPSVLVGDSGQTERVGEIFVIGIDPDHHGQGLGVPMTLAGLDWLAGRGLTNGMLYVEADNAPALGTYKRIGFRHHRTDRAWRRQLR